MNSALLVALHNDGLVWIIIAAFVAGVVRGFAGFGTAMIFLPIATQFLNPFAAIAAMTIMDLVGPLPIVRAAWRDAYKPDLGRLVVGMAVVLPVAIYCLTLMDPMIFRYSVSFLAIGMLVILLLGLRYRGDVKPGLVYGIGGFSGVTGGLAGIPGPPVILFYMASQHPVRVIRANSLLFLFGFDFFILINFMVMGQLTLNAVVMGLLLIFPILLGNLLGAYFFNPEKEKLYRYCAYVVIAVSAVSGLPFFD